MPRLGWGFIIDDLLFIFARVYTGRVIFESNFPHSTVAYTGMDSVVEG